MTTFNTSYILVNGYPRLTGRPVGSDVVKATPSRDGDDAVSRNGFDTNEASESTDEDQSREDDLASGSDSDSSINESSESEDETPRFGETRKQKFTKKHLTLLLSRAP